LLNVAYADGDLVRAADILFTASVVYGTGAAAARDQACTPSLPSKRRHLALSTNNIEKISSLAGMDSLKILSLGRNLIKKVTMVHG
jgi:Leucine-rich repeat (LRR) protein